MPILIRLMNDEDKNFIHSTWTTNMYSAKPHSFSAWSLFCKHQDDLIEDIFTISKTLVACLAEDPETILGYLTYSYMDTLIVHFGYIKNNFRKNKIMSDLLEAADPQYKKKLIIFTQTTKSYSSLAEKYTITYDPWCIDMLLTIKENQ